MLQHLQENVLINAEMGIWLAHNNNVPSYTTLHPMLHGQEQNDCDLSFPLFTPCLLLLPLVHKDETKAQRTDL
jgi:hypothetical protein